MTEGTNELQTMVCDRIRKSIEPELNRLNQLIQNAPDEDSTSRIISIKASIKMQCEALCINTEMALTAQSVNMLKQFSRPSGIQEILKRGDKPGLAPVSDPVVEPEEG